MEICFLLGILITYCPRFVLGQKVTLKSYRQEDSDTRCTHGLISGVDNVVFKAGVDYTEDAAIKYVHFYLLRNTDTIPLLYVAFNLQENCQSYDTYRCRHTGPTTLGIEIRVKASKDYSGAKIHGKIFPSESFEINSEYQLFPQIYDSTDVTGRLLINGKEIPINSEDCMIRVNEPEINIVFNCESQATPCWTVISTNDSTTAAVQGVGLTVYNKRLENLQDLFITIKYGVCSFDIPVNTIGCKIKPDLRMSTESNSNKFDLQLPWYLDVVIVIGVTLVILIIIVLLTIWIFCYWVRKTSRLRKDQNHDDVSGNQLLSEKDNSKNEV